jgi:dTDP-4-dehydrorhamnose reductase
MTTRVLVVGATGMLGHTVFGALSRVRDLEVWGTLRDPGHLKYFSAGRQARLIADIDATNLDALTSAFDRARPHAVINCVGVIKQLASSHDPLVVLPINAMLPHQLSRLCGDRGARLVHISTDCVFEGTRGGYRESDKSDTVELYGQSKYIGEVRDVPHAITLRSSIIGHELHSQHGLVEWFLSQTGTTRGFTKAIFSGLPTIEMARIISDVVLPRPDLHGLYHVSAAAISKHDLLQLVAAEYGQAITIVPDPTLVIDRSLNSERFSAATGYVAPAWPVLIKAMRASRDT